MTKKFGSISQQTNRLIDFFNMKVAMKAFSLKYTIKMIFVRYLENIALVYEDYYRTPSFNNRANKNAKASFCSLS